jgi:tetratricopeptide (TPR) repeat protein|tara:strand:+ start:1091 stop:3442 length:2352 start_codon:yes stop_codon:yes gene_type:complete
MALWRVSIAEAIKSLSCPLGPMQQTTMAILTLYGALSITLLALWFRHKSVLRQRKRLALKLGSIKGNLTETSERLDLLSRGVDTILSDAPEVHDLLGVHKSLEAAESLLFNQGIPVSNSESCAIVSHAVKALLSHYPEDVPEDGRSIVQGLKPLSKRLAAILTEAEMKAEDVEISASEHRRAGELFHSVERFDWAADCFQRANDLDPEDESALRSLSAIQRESGDFESLDRTLERLLAIVPDDIAVLNEQSVLLDATDDERLIRNRKRLEGLGAASLPTEEEGELSLIAQRARESGVGGATQSDTAPRLIEKAAKQLLLGEFRAALESVDAAIERDHGFGQAWSLKARLVAASDGSTKDALKCIRRANALGEYTVILESEILDNDGRTDAAIEVLEEHLSRTPGDAEARGKLSQLWLSSGSAESALKTLDDAPEESWGSATLHVMKGRLSLVESDEHRDETGKIDPIPVIDALASFDRAVEIDRESGLAWLGRARALRYQKAFDEAEVALVRARRLIPDHPSISLEEAQLSLETGDLEQANALTLEATTTLKENPTVSFIRGIIAARNGRLEEATKLFSQTLQLDPKHTRARLNRSSAALLGDDLALALDDANQLVEDRPNHELARLRKSEILMNQGDWANAESELRELLRLNGNHSMGLVHLGTCMIAMEKSEQAEKPLNKAIETNPGLSEAWYQRGLLYLDFGRSDEAMSDFEGAVRADSQHLDARLRIAAILHEGKDTEKAAGAWRKVLDVDPQNRLARRRLEECRSQITSRREELLPKD